VEIGQRGLYRTLSVVVHRKQLVFARYRSSVSVKAIPDFLFWFSIHCIRITYPENG
jgi:hypothetical protein